MENVPLVPAIFVCGTKVCALSTSLTVSVPPVVNGALVSARVTVAELSTAASFVPLIVTCTVLVVPSADATVKVDGKGGLSGRRANVGCARYVKEKLAA